MFRSIMRFVALSSLGILLLACGGGGSDSKPQPSPGAGLSVTPTTINFSAEPGGTLPDAQYLFASISSSEAAYIVAGYTSQVPSWLQLSNLSGAGHSWSVQLNVMDTSLAAGNYSAVLRVAIERSDKSVIGYVDVKVNYTTKALLRAAPASLNYSHIVGGSAAPAQTISITGSGLPWTATANQTWIKLASTSGTAPDNLGVSVDPAGLNPGTYNGTITISHTGGSDTATVNVQLVVQAAMLVSNLSDTLSFSGVNGAVIASQTVTIAMNNGAAVGWTTSAGAGWIVLGSTNGTTPGDLVIGVNAAALATGTYNSDVTVKDSTGTLSLKIPVSLDLTRATLFANPGSLTIGGTNGRDLSAQAFQISLDTGSNGFAWTASADKPWIVPSATSGTVSASGTPLTVTVDTSTLKGGTYSGNVKFSAQVNGDSVTAALPVTLNLEAHKLLASDAGVAFASMPTLKKLSRTLQVRDNFGKSTPWSASSNQTWLTVTPSGTTTGNLLLTADPASLATDTVHYATVTLASSDATVENTETIQVGLWVGSTDPASVHSVDGTLLAASFTHLVVDPVRPYVYVNDGTTDTIIVYNLYTGAIVRGIPSVGAQLGSMNISMDGTRLFAVDVVNTTIVPVDLSNDAVGAPWPVTAGDASDLAYSRTDGTGLVFITSGQIFNAQTGVALDIAPFYGGTVIAASQDGSHICTANVDVSPSNAYWFPVSYTALDGGKLLVGAGGMGSINGYRGDIALNASGTRVYAAAGGMDAFGVFDTTNLTDPNLPALPGGLHCNNVEIAKDGRIFAAAGPIYATMDTWIYSAEGASLGSYRTVSDGHIILPASLKVSGDGLCMVVLTDDLQNMMVFKIVAP